MIRQTYTLICDACDRNLTADHPTVGPTLTEAVSRGWVINILQHLCPACSTPSAKPVVKDLASFGKLSGITL